MTTWLKSIGRTRVFRWRPGPKFGMWFWSLAALSTAARIPGHDDWGLGLPHGWVWASLVIDGTAALVCAHRLGQRTAIQPLAEFFARCIEGEDTTS